MHRNVCYVLQKGGFIRKLQRRTSCTARAASVPMASSASTPCGLSSDRHMAWATAVSAGRASLTSGGLGGRLALYSGYSWCLQVMKNAHVPV